MSSTSLPEAAGHPAAADRERAAAAPPACNACGELASTPLLRKDGFDLVRCARCGLISVANPPTDEQRARLYSFDAGYHSSLVDDAASKAFHEREAALNLRVLRRFANGGRLLDIGCSTGLFLRAARDIGWVGQGLEYSPDSSRIARDEHGLEVRTGELRADTYPAASFDVVTMWDVIEHVPDPFATLVQVRRILADGGQVLLKTPNADGLYPRLSLRLAGRLGFWGHAEPPGHLFQFSVASLSRLAERAGFRVVDVCHQRIPLGYSFGTPRGWFRSARWAAYCAMFMPMAWLGPWVRQGDDQVLVLEKA
jgi:SAM-dependent methyltransferase